MVKPSALSLGRGLSAAVLLLALAGCGGGENALSSGSSTTGASAGVGASTGMGTGAVGGAGMTLGSGSTVPSGATSGGSGLGGSGTVVTLVDSGFSPPMDAGEAGPTEAGPTEAGSDVTTDGGVPTTITSANWSETLYPFSKRRMILRDEGNPHLHLLDLGTPANDWATQTDGPYARSAQLVGNNQVLGGRSDGYEIYDLQTGRILKVVQGFPDTQAAYRMANGETMLAQTGGHLNFLDASDRVTHTISYPGYSYVRLVRPTRRGTFLVPSDTVLFEGDANGNVLWSTAPTGLGWGHIFEALPMASGDVIVSTFFGSSLDVVDRTTHMVTFRYGTKALPNAAMLRISDFAEFQILPNGNFITANWLSSGPGNAGNNVEIIEFDPTGAVVWFYKTDPAVFSAIQGVMVIDGLDPQYLHVEETEDGTWQPVK